MDIEEYTDHINQAISLLYDRGFNEIQLARIKDAFLTTYNLRSEKH